MLDATSLGEIVSAGCPYEMDVSEDGDEIGVVAWDGETYCAVAFKRTMPATTLTRWGERIAYSLAKARGG